MRDTAKSFHWIVSLLGRHQVPFVITGGLAAKIYGSPRALNDIDLDIPSAAFDLIAPEVASFATYGPARYTGTKWDLPLITLDHEGQEVDIGAADDTRIHDGAQWVEIPSGLDDAWQMELFGLTVPVIAPQKLIAYKSMLDGDHQLVDIRAVQEFLKLKA